MSQTFKYSLYIFFLLLILINCRTIFELEYKGLRSGLLVAGITQPPGKAFLPLRPFLKDVHVVGYYTDYRPEDAEFNLPLQFVYVQAKFALSPTILDRDHPGAHEYLLVYLYSPDSFARILKWHVQIIAKGYNNIVLLKRL